MIEQIKHLVKLFEINGFYELKDTNIFKEFIEIKEQEVLIENTLQCDNLCEEDIRTLYEASMDICKLSYYSYFKLTFTANNPLVLGRHIELICDVLTLAEMGLFKDKDTKSRIAISVPPRHLKSTSITNSFPSWFMGKEPWRSTIVTSYGDNLVQKAGQKNREKVQDLGLKLFGARIKKDVGKKAEWELEGGGRFKGATIRGGATGEGAECFVGSTMVMTNKGLKRIDELDVDFQHLILSYDHKNDIIRYNKLQATRRKKSNEIYKIKTNSGKEIECTGNHPIYTEEKGYTEASKLRRGDTIKSYNDLSKVWQELHNTEVRIQEKNKAWLQDELLFEEMQRGLYGNRWSCKTKKAYVSYMWETYKKKFDSLFRGVQTKSEKKLQKKYRKRIRRYILPYLQKEVQAKIKKNDILFQELPEQSTFFKNEREKQFSSYEGEKPEYNIFQDKRKYKRKRSQKMLKVWCRGRVCSNKSREKNNKFTCSSHRWGSHEQCRKQFSNFMQELSQDCTQKERIDSIEIIKKEEWVYDIQVENDHNFFANGVLVHNCLICDDVVKNREEANSKTIQEKVWDEYTDTYLTRVHQNGIIIIIMTRWHNSDLRGKIDEAEKNLKWLKCDVSAICENEQEAAEDPLEREVGEALYPQMYDERYFEPFKMNPRTWWSLYKQKPQVDSGEYFNRGYFQYFEYDQNFVTLYTETVKKQFLIKDCWVFQTIDTAQKTGQENDETALLTIAVTPENDLLFLDLYHDRIKVPDQEKVITQYWNKWQCSYQAIEDKQSGTGLIQKFIAEGRPIKELKAAGDKVERSTTAQVFYANMKIYHLKGAEWLGYLEDQLLGFGSGAPHDDVVDVVSYAAIQVAKDSGISSIL